MTDNDLDRMRKSSYLLPDPGGEVVRELLDEIERLKEVITTMSESVISNLDKRIS